MVEVYRIAKDNFPKLMAQDKYKLEKAKKFLYPEIENDCLPRLLNDPEIRKNARVYAQLKNVEYSNVYSISTIYVIIAVLLILLGIFLLLSRYLRKYRY